MNAHQLQESRIHAAHGARVAQRHGADQVLLEPLHRLAGREPVDFGRRNAAIDRPRHQRQARGVAGWSSSAISATAASAATQGWQIAIRCVPGPMASQEVHQVLDVLVEAEAAGGIGTSRALCQSVMYTSWSASIVRAVSRSSVAKWPDIGATISTGGPGPACPCGNAATWQNGVLVTASSRTRTSRSSDRDRVEAEGRAHVRERASSEDFAARQRACATPSRRPGASRARCNAGSADFAAVRNGHSRSVCV